jgi:CHAT domain-containing protein
VLSGELTDRVDLHALPFGRDGDVLADAFVVEHATGAVARPDPSRGTALVVADPGNDLPLARAEGSAVAAALAARGLSVRTLVGHEARSDAVHAGLVGASWFHYAGHGVHAGLEGWESTLPLAERGVLTVGDVLVLGAAPARVVLSACETTRGLEGLGIARAFAIAGAREVIGPTRAVADDLAARIVPEVYAVLAARPDRDLAGALAEVVRRERRAHPDADWSAFRALIP